MAWSTYQLILVFFMVVTGSLNSLSTKWADTQESLGTEIYHVFLHPIFQALCMFLGECLCLIVYLIWRCISKQYDYTYEESTKFNPLIFLPASLCDMFATSMLYVGLNMTNISSYQMLQGSVIIFTAFLSVTFLQHTFKPILWIGIIVVILGLALVGISDIFFGENRTKSDLNSIITGDLLILAAQVVIATQMVYEEKVIKKYNVAVLKAVGLEGLFGVTILGLLLIPFYYINGGVFFHTNPKNRLEDPLDAFEQMKNNHIIAIAVTGNIISIAFYNFCAVSITKERNSTTRMILDSLRAIVIWSASIAIGWHSFEYLQFVGFFLLLVGIFYCYYYDILFMPLINKCIFKQRIGEERVSPLMSEYDSNEEITQPLLSTCSEKVNPSQSIQRLEAIEQRSPLV